MKEIKSILIERVGEDQTVFSEDALVFCASRTAGTTGRCFLLWRTRPFFVVVLRNLIW
jgi:hypothetical protein